MVLSRKEFQKLMEDWFEEIRELNTLKGSDYAGGNDSFANFKRGAEALELAPEQVWAVYAHKHWDAVMTYCRDGDVKSEPIDGRILDLILYLFLLRGIVENAKKNKSKKRPDSGKKPIQ